MVSNDGELEGDLGLEIKWGERVAIGC